MSSLAPAAHTSIGRRIARAPAPNGGRVAVRDTVGFLVLLLCLVAIELWAEKAFAAVTRPLWLDEIHTLLLAGRQDTGESLRSLAAGSDFNPPALYLMYRLIGHVTGGLTDVSMRVVALASVTIAVAMVYRLLRETCDRVSSAAGALAVWAQPVVATAAFDARFYGPLLAAASTLIWAVRRVSAGERGSAVWWLAVVSVFLCTVHYFGVLSWLATMVVVLFRAGDTRRQLALRLLPGLAGPIALLACVPIYLGQRAALRVATWVPAISIGDAAFLLVTALLPLCLLTALIAWAASGLLRRAATPNESPGFASIGPAGFLLLGQAVVPVALIVLSLVVQPLTEPRYGIVSSLAVAPIVGVAASRSLAPLRMAIIAAAIILSAGIVGDAGRDARAFDRRVREDAEYALRATREGVPLVIRRRHTLYPLLRALPQANRVAVLFDEPSAARDSLLIAVDRDVARVHRARYGFPNLATAADLRSTRAFYFVEYDPANAPPRDWFPGHAAERVDQRLFRFRLR